MKPIGPLMWEHRLIERMLNSVEKITAQINSGFDPVLIDTIVDFIRTYADRTHHGKEEDILFRDMKKKPLSAEHERIMNELVEEHVFARKTVGRLVKAKEDFLKGNAGSLSDITECLKTLTEFYPSHIEKEDKHFFFPIMEYFSKEEQDTMLAGFYEFDRNMIHEKYNKIADAVENQL